MRIGNMFRDSSNLRHTAWFKVHIPKLSSTSATDGGGRVLREIQAIFYAEYFPKEERIAIIDFILRLAESFRPSPSFYKVNLNIVVFYDFI